MEWQETGQAATAMHTLDAWVKPLREGGLQG